MRVDILELIRTRRSVREFKRESVSKRTIEKILEAGRWAPSGLNNQPWKYMVLEKEKKNSLARYTKYSHIIKSADKVILVFLDRKSSYNREKDLMAIGASIQNMLLCIHSQGLGACWLGEILNQRAEIREFLKLSKNLELEAVLALGRPVNPVRCLLSNGVKFSQVGKRKQLKNLIIKVQ